MAFIRTYQPSDEEDVIHVFRETASPELKEAGDPTLHYASFNWARPYTYLVPQHCLVIDDSHGKAVGYLLGVPDTSRFVNDFQQGYHPYLESQGLTRPPPIKDGEDPTPGDLALGMRRITWQPEEMLHSKTPNLLQQYPAHLHIDILPAYQGQGWGRKMIEEILRRFQSMGVQGIHLGKVGSNMGAGQFYAKLGFNRFPEAMDSGESGEVGRMKDGGIYLVKKLSP